VTNLGADVQDLIKQNNAIDIYDEYFTGQWADHSAEVPSVKTVTVFKDPSNSVKRSTAYVNWHPDATIPKVAVSYAILQFQDSKFQDMPLSSYVWDVNNPNTPEFEMAPTSQICCAKFNLKDPNVVRVCSRLTHRSVCTAFLYLSQSRTGKVKSLASCEC